MNERETTQDLSVSFIVNALSTLTSRPPVEVAQLLLRESKLIGTAVQQAAAQFGLQSHIWNQQLMDFYASTDAFLFETATWNLTRMKQVMRRFVVRQLQSRLPPQSRVLCFGDGMGFDSEVISGAGFDVTCFEVSGPCLKFAEELFGQNQRSVQIETDFEALTKQKFDAIICLDVLEHVPDPPALVRQFHDWLNDNGLFIVHAPYYHVDATRPTHLEVNRQYAGQVESLYEAVGFQLLAVGGFLLDPLVFIKRPQSPPRAPVIKRMVGKGLTSLCRKYRDIPSAAAFLFTRVQRRYLNDLKAIAGGATPGQ